MQQHSIGVFLYCWFAPVLLSQGFAVCIARDKETLMTTVDVEYGDKEMSVQHKSPAVHLPSLRSAQVCLRAIKPDEETLTTCVDVEYCHKEIKPQQQSLEASMTNSVKDMLMKRL